MEKQGILLITPPKHTCYCDPFCKRSREPSCMLNIVCRTERDFAAREKAWQVTLPGNLAHSFWKCFKSIKKSSVLGHKKTSDWITQKPCSGSSMPRDPWHLLKGSLPILVEPNAYFALKPFWKDRQGVHALDCPKRKTCAEHMSAHWHWIVQLVIATGVQRLFWY